MTNPHRRNKAGSPEHRKSVKDIHLSIEKSNRLKRVGKVRSKLAVVGMPSGFGKQPVKLPANTITSDKIDIDKKDSEGFSVRNDLEDLIGERISEKPMRLEEIQDLLGNNPIAKMNEKISNRIIQGMVNDKMLVNKNNVFSIAPLTRKERLGKMKQKLALHLPDHEGNDDGRLDETLNVIGAGGADASRFRVKPPLNPTRNILKRMTPKRKNQEIKFTRSEGLNNLNDEEDFFGNQSFEDTDNMLLGEDKKFDEKNFLGVTRAVKFKPRRRTTLAKLKQKLAGFGRPPQRVLDAFKARKKDATKSFVSDGKRLLFNGNEVARHTRKGIEVSYAGFPTAMTSATIRGLGIDTRTVKGVTTINGQRIDPTKTDFHLVPNANISDKPFRVGTPTKVITPENRKMIDDQETFRKKVQLKETGVAGRIAEDTTVIQPRDQKFINNLTGVKSEIPEKTLGTDTHHILPKKKFPGLRTNVNNGLPLSRVQHRDLHRLNARLVLMKVAVKLRAFTNSSSFVGNMRYDQEEQSMTGILSGKHYKWCDIPERIFDGFQGAGSAGAYFNRAVKGQFDCGGGGILTKVQSKLSKLKATFNNNENINNGMIQLAKNQSADGIINTFIKGKHNIQGVSGVYDPINSKILDATRPTDAMNLQKFYDSGTKNIGFNSITDTRHRPATDIESIRNQLKQIEQSGGVPALGFDNGSLEAVSVILGSDDEILGKLLDHQNSTGILGGDLSFRILDNPRFRK